METSENSIILAALPIGARLIYETKKDLREAVVSRIAEDKVTLIVCSPSGNTYRVRRTAETILYLAGAIPFLTANPDINWREALVKYDVRW